MKHFPLRTAFPEAIWAVSPETLDQVGALLALRGGPARSRKGSAADTSQRVVLLNVFGVLFQRVGPIEEMFGGISTEAIGDAFTKAAREPSVGTIVLNLDTPGGSVSGIPELAAQIAAAPADKRVIAMINSVAASGGYWIASAADQIVMTPGGITGSVGVLSVHQSTAAGDEMRGIKTTITRMPASKGEGTAGEPLTDAAAAHRQRLVDQAYEMFVGDVAKYRRTKPDQVKRDYGQGRVVNSRDALKSKMVDRVATLDDVLGELGMGPNANRPAFTLAGLT
jgi:signal peptide peptidase SppA